MTKKFCERMVRAMRRARCNPGPHPCPVVEVPDTPGVVFGASFMKVPSHLQGYVVEYVRLGDKGHWRRSELLQEVFWATMKALPEWLEKAPREASFYELRGEWEVVAVIDDGDQD